MHFYLDNRHNGTDSLVEPELAKFQGPALLAYNNAVFTDDDWQSIQDLQQSVKTKDPFKVGKFGIGFNSVYHITGNVLCTQVLLSLGSCSYNGICSFCNERLFINTENITLLGGHVCSSLIH